MLAAVLLLLATVLLAAPAARAQDVDPPVIRILEGGVDLADGSLWNRSVTPVIEVTDASPVTVDATLDAAPFTSGTAVSGEGTHQLSVSATDDAGNASSLSVSFEIDTVAPVFATLAPTDGTLTAAAEVTLTGEVAGASSVTVDGQPATLAGSSFSAGPFSLTEGERIFSVVAADAAGNTATRAHRVVRDSTAPAVSLSQPAAGAVVGASPVDVVGSVSDPHLAEVTVNGTVAAVTGSTFVARNVPVAEGSTTLLARAVDAAGNAAEAQRPVVLDTQAPAVAVTDPAAGTVTPVATLQVSGSATDPHLSRVEVNGVAATVTGGTWSASVPLVEGANDLTATAWDTLGHSATATVSVLRDSTAPEVRITAPADGAFLSAEAVDVSGTVGDEPEITVTVNGTPATVTPGGGTATWSLPSVPLVEGENRLIARVTDQLGNQGAHTRIVYRDTVAPEWTTSDPVDGALALSPSAPLVVRFSEALADPAAGAWRLELADGTPLPAQATLAGEVLTVQPDQPLPSQAEVRLVLTAALVDPAGNALANSATLSFTAADVEAPPAPVLGSLPASPLCAPTLALSGTAEPDAVVRAAGGAAGAEARVATDGTFALLVPLRPATLNRVELTVRDRDDNVSAATVVEVVQDCAGPLVVSAERSGDGFVVTFDEAVDPATLGLADGLVVRDANGPLTGTVAASPDGTAATFAADAPLPAGALRLEVGRGVRDLAGNPLGFPYSQVFGADVAPSFLAGRVLDAHTGRPLSGAQVVVLSTDGLALSEPRPEQTTAADGRFRIPVAAGTHYLAVGAVGYTPVMRLAPSTSGLGTDVFDARLTPMAEAQVLGSGGGTFGDPSRRGEGPSLGVPAGALAADAPVSVTALDEQALPALLPYGWSPRGAVWVDLDGAALSAAVDLTFPVDAPDGTGLVVIALDTATLQWNVVAEATVFDGAVGATASGEGAWAAVQADLGPPVPPSPVVGAVLGSAPAPVGDEATAAAVTFDPALVLPSQSSLATVTYTLGADAASGMPVTVTIREELTLLDGSVRREAPYDTDVLVFRAPDGTPRSRFRLRPSEQAARLPLQVGAEDVGVHRYAGDTLQGNVLGPLGGTVTNTDGDRVDLPAGSLPEPTAVLLERLAEADLPLAVPNGFAFLGYLELDLSGRELAVPGTLTLELGAAPTPGEAGLLFQVVELAGVKHLRPVAALAATSSGWTTAAIDPLDLPWPGVRSAGRYLFARQTADLAYLRGSVHGVGGGLAPGLRVTGSVDGVDLGWLQLSNPAGDTVGRYVLPAPLGAATAVATDLLSGDVGSGAGTLATADQRVDLDLFLQVTGPQVVEIVPGDGAVDVPPGVEPTVRFSEDVDPVTLASGVLLYDGVDPVAVTLERQGTLVRVIPQATLRPATAYELRVTTALRDLQGNRLATGVTSTFTTRASVVGDGLDRSRIHLFEPDGAGQARVLGRSGAVPGGSLVFVENITSFVATSSVTAAVDGSFELTVGAGLDDTLLLHVLVDGGNEVVWELTPFLAADGRGAHVGTGAVAFTTLDDLTVEVEAGTFLRPTVVRVEPKPAVSPAPVPSDFDVLAAFELDFGGAEAQKKLHVSLPTPAGLVGDEVLLARVWRIFGSDYWMLHDLMRRDGDRLTTRPPLDEAVAALAEPIRRGPLGPTVQARIASLSGLAAALSAPQESDGPTALSAPARMGDRQEYLPGSANPGLYLVMENQTPLDFVVFPFLPARYAWYQQQGLDGMILAINAHIEQLLAFDGILMPTRRGLQYTVQGRELDSGYRFFEGTFDPPAPDSLQFLPPDLFGDVDRPFPVAGSPLRFFVVNPALATTRELDLGVRMELVPAAGLDPARLVFSGSAKAVGAGAALVLLGLDDEVSTAATAAADGSFNVSTAVVPGNRYLLGIGAEVGPRDALEITFSEGMDLEAAGIEVRDSRDLRMLPQVEPVGTSQTVRISPRPAWKAGESYRLILRPSLSDAAGNSWDETLQLRFQVATSRELDTFSLATVRDVERVGGLLFVAAGEDGLVVLDGSDPGNLRNVVAGDIRFPFPLADPVTALAVDPHGRVLVAGGGVNGFGQLKIFDPQAFDPPAIAANPTDPAVRYGAFRGSTVVSDSPASGTSLPEGQPRHLAVLSDDEKSAWRIGLDAPPSGIAVDPATPPVDGDWTVTLTGGDGTPNQAVTVRNLTRGRWRRSDADGSGAWSVTLTVEAGDRVEVLRNRQTLAYLATLGVGIQVVDVNAFYGESPEAWDDPAPLSDVAGTYTGFGDPTLRLCNESISDIGTSLLDLGTLVGDPGHPLTLVGLIAFRGLGMFESDPADVGNISFYGDACARLGGTAHVFGLDVAEDYPFDLDGNGHFDSEEYRDYVVVTHRSQGVLIFDVTDRENPELAGHVRLDGQAERVTVDRDQRRLFVSAAGGGLYVLDFDLPPRVDMLDGNLDLLDDRVLEVVSLAGNTNSEAFLFPELGLAFAGGTDRGLTGVAVGEPKLVVVADAAGSDGDSVGVPRFRPVSRLAPLGVPTAPSGSEVGSPDLAAAFRVLAALPGVVGDEVRLDLVSLGPGGLPIDGAGDPALISGLPRTALVEGDGLLFRRLASDRHQEGYQLFLSEEVVAVADLRAARDYTRTALEDAQCQRCDHAALGAGAGARQILSGHRIAVRFPATLRSTLAGTYDGRLLDLAEVAVESVPWEVAPSVRQEPALNPALSQGDAVPGTLLDSGEMTVDALDLFVRGRGLDFAFHRSYRSQTVGAGPLGPGWDHVYHQRLRDLPNGDVEYYDGTGRRELFQRRADGGYDSPPGRFVDLDQSLARTSAGWLLITAQRVQLRFDGFGRLVSIADPSKDSADTGNRLELRYDLASRLSEVIDSLDRRTSLSYDASGRLTALTDFSGRTVSYGYDALGRLSAVTSPAVTVGSSPFPDGLTTNYTYTASSGALAVQLNGRDNLVDLVDPRGTTRFSLDWADGDGDGRAEEVATQQWGAGTVQIAYDFGASTTTVTDRRNQVRVYGFDGEGHLTSSTDPLGHIYTFTYDSEGNLVSQESPLGTRTQLSYDTTRGPRSRGNVQQVRIDPGALGPNGSAEALTTAIQHDPTTNLPTRVTDPRGTVTEIERNFAGLPESIRRAAGTDDAAQTVVEYDDHGQPTRLVDAAGRQVALEYYDSGPMRGYLARRVVDPGGLGLVTRFEYDARGNLVARTDPRGVRHEWVYDELDRVVEERRAVSPSHDGAGSLSYVTRFLHDENGNVVEQQLPYGDGTTFTRLRTVYGPLDEVLSVAAERTDEVWIQESYGYDPNLNLTQVTSPEGEITRHHYDPRNLPIRTETGLPQFDPPLEVLRTYDAEGRLKTESDPLGRVAEIFYDGYQRPRSTEDPLGNVVQVIYDDGGNPVEIQRRNGAGCLLSLQRTSRDPLGRPVEQTGYLWTYPPDGDPCTDLPGDARAVTESFVYDGTGRLLRRTDPSGRTSVVTYDGAGRPRLMEDAAGNLLETLYDAAGNPVREETTELAPDGSTVTVVQEHRYDALGRRIATQDALGNETRWLYDARGNAVGVVDAEGHLTEHAYDGLDRRTSTTQPEGIRVELEYDAASRPVVYRDSLGNETTWSYDDLGRPVSITFADGAVRSFEYDAAGNPTRITDPRGTVVDQTFDVLDRLTSRTVTPSIGVEGATTQAFAFDGLGRLVRAENGAIATDLAYDSLSRLLEETTAGRTLRFAWDDAGNEIGLEYPSGYRVGRQLDALNRPMAIGSIPSLPVDGAAPQIGERMVGYAYRGPVLLAEKVLGPELSPVTSGRMTYDPARRLVSTLYEDATLERVFEETLTWTPRSLKATQLRPDLADRLATFSYDGASRLTATARTSGPAAAAVPQAWSFGYDAAQNLLAREERTPWGDDLTSLPVDASGRNRPAAVDGVALEYDLAGNLTRKGDRTFHYDAFNRLVRVAGPGGTIATYRYDAFNRRVEAVVGSTTRTTTWAGWQALETRTDGVLGERRTFGLGLDEVVLVERDTDGDGVPDQRYRPLFDSIGNVALLVDEAGQILERYDYSPFGQRWVRVNDLTPPQVEQLRIDSGVLLVELSEEVSRATLEAAETAGLLVLEETAAGTPVPFTWSLPATESRAARRRLVFTPDVAPAAGAEIRLSLGVGALADLFGNATTVAHDQTFPWQAGVVTDTASPELLVVALSQSHLQVTFSEPVDSGTATAALLVDGATTVWTTSADGYILETTSALSAGSHTLRIETTLTDLAGQVLATAFETTFEVAVGTSDRLVHLTPNPHLLTTSTVANLYGFHGRPVDPETGLMYFRNRYYDPEMGRFVSTDPLGYVDGPNLYQYGLNSPANYSDPLGLCPTCIQDLQERETSAHLASLSPQEQQEFMAADWKSSRNKTSYVVGFVPIAGEVHDVSQLITGRDYVSGEVLSTGERVFVGVATFVPLVGGKVIREAGMALVARFDRWLGFDEIFEKGMRGFQEGAEPLGRVRAQNSVHPVRDSMGKLIPVDVDDPAARALAKRLNRSSSVRFEFDIERREFDVISDRYVAQSKPANFKLGSAFRLQAKKTFEAAIATGRTPYFHFDGAPHLDVLRKLRDYGERYGVAPVIDTKPLD